LAEQFYTILTAIGKAKLANSISLGTKVNFSTLKVGDGNGNYYEPTESQTDLVNINWQGGITSVRTDEDNPNWIVVEVVIPSAIGGFTIREAGIFDDEGNMLAIGKYPESYKPIFDDGSVKELLIRMIFEVSNAASIEMKIDPTIVLATKADLEKKVDKIDYVRAGGYAVTTGTSTAYTITLNPAPVAYVDGMQITILPHVDCGANPTLKVNGLGASTILNQDGTTINAGDMKANIPYSFVRVGSSFFIRSAGKTSFDRLFTVNPWKYVGANVPNARACGTAQSYNNKIYYIGGNISGTTSALMDIYDIATNTWASGVSMPVALDMPTSQIYNGKIYVFGTATNIYIYDIATNTWSVGASANGYSRNEAVSELYNGKIYVFGGTYGSCDIATVYDIATNTWSGITNMPSTWGRRRAHSALDNGIIYICGGMSSDGTVKADISAYTIATNTWATNALPYMKANTARGGSMILNRKWYIFGGWNLYNAYMNAVQSYDLSTGSGGAWVYSTGMPTSRQGTCSTKVNNKIYVMGGTDFESGMSKIEVFCPVV
jgi:N-acetylneuraminic acid mutarotase